MDALAGYSDDSSDDDQPQQANALSSLAMYGDGDDSDNVEPQPKRAKHTEAAEASNKSSSYLPSPILGNDSLIKSETDYFSAKYNNVPSGECKMPPKLQQLSSQTKNLAEQLKSQHEFHNPAFFQNLVQHFGIKDELGGGVESFHSYEFDLVRLEEEARMRQQQQTAQPVATPTAYAQEQLDRVMQRHRG